MEETGNCIKGMIKVKFNDKEKENLSKQLLEIINKMPPSDENGWINLADLGTPLSMEGIEYKKYGYPKLSQFINNFNDILEFKSTDSTPPVYYVRPYDSTSENRNTTHTINAFSQIKTEKYPSKDTDLLKWAWIDHNKVEALSKLALNEKWYYGNTQKNDQSKFPILWNYLKYTFKRLCYEDKILIKIDPDRNEEYAAFNTGLVDKKYEYIYALFKQNYQNTKYYWYLLDFVVKGEDVGKTLVKVFNPLPQKADYFQNKIENMLYDTTTGDLSCDYTHVITEHTERLPLEFLKDNCSEDFLYINGKNIDDIYHLDIRKPDRQAYFNSLGLKIKNNPRIFNRLKNRISDAIELAKKRVEWNYKTAIPMYYPTRNTCSLLLPLSLMDDDHVDLALVVERQPSGSYQGQTILPLYLAYTDSRLITRPDSDWLKTDTIYHDNSEELDSE